MLFLQNNSNPKEDKFVQDSVVFLWLLAMGFGKVCRRTLEVWAGKSSSVDSSLGRSLGAWWIRVLRAAQTMEAWFVTLGKQTLWGHMS